MRVVSNAHGLMYTLLHSFDVGFGLPWLAQLLQAAFDERESEGYRDKKQKHLLAQRHTIVSS